MNLRKRNAVKEAFDNLPSGVAFFDRNGTVILCNHQMYRLVFDLTGKDLQKLSEIQAIIDGEIHVKQRDNDIFFSYDGSAWRFTQESITAKDGNVYTQVIAANVTVLYNKRKELEREKQSLEEYAERMRRLSANIIAFIREEEILNMKMRIHDDIGRSAIATRRLLQQRRPTEELDLTAWKNAVRLLRHENASEEKDALTRLKEAASGIGIDILFDGELPSNKEAANLLIAAMRECATNAVRHAGATELYVNLRCDGEAAYAKITNNGALPQAEVTEGGGLSSLRTRIEKRKGTMAVRTKPVFELTVAVPINKEETS